MDETTANSAVRGLIFGVQKARSNLMESLGDSEIAKELLGQTNPWLFGPKSILAPLLEWQRRCSESGTIAGTDLFNFTKMIELKDPIILGLLPIYGYPNLEPDASWMAQTWHYLTDGS